MMLKDQFKPILQEDVDAMEAAQRRIQMNSGLRPYSSNHSWKRKNSVNSMGRNGNAPSPNASGAMICRGSSPSNSDGNLA